MQADFDSGKVLRKGKSWWEQLGATNETYKRLNKNIEEISSSPYPVAQSNRVGLLTSNLHAPKFLYQSHLECRYLDIKNRRTSPSLFPNDKVFLHIYAFYPRCLCSELRDLCKLKLPVTHSLVAEDMKMCLIMLETSCARAGGKSCEQILSVQVVEKNLACPPRKKADTILNP